MFSENFDLSFLGTDFNNGLFYTCTVDGDGYGTDGTVAGIHIFYIWRQWLWLWLRLRLCCR
jgi:hypothetical protein